MHIIDKLLFITFSALAFTSKLSAEEDEHDVRMEREMTICRLPHPVSRKDIEKAAEGWPKQFAGHKIRFIRLDHGGSGWDDGMSEPVAELYLMQALADSVGLKSAQRGESHRMALLAKYPDNGMPPFVYLTGNGAMGQTTLADREILRAYCLKAGMLIADAGNTDFHKSFLEFMNQVFPDKKLVEIPADDVIYQFPNALTVGASSSLESRGAKPLGIKEGDRWIVFYHPGDMNDTWKSPDHTDATPEMRKVGIELGKNLLHYAFNQWCSKTLREALNSVRSHRQAKNFEAAISGLDALNDIKDVQSQVQIYMARAEVYYDMENYVAAREEIKRVLEYEPKHADALILRGKCAVKTERLIEPIEPEK